MTVRVYNRPAIVEKRYEDSGVARVRYQDNGMLDYVPLDEVDAEEEES